MTKEYKDCTVYVTECKDGTIDVSWRRNYPINDKESKDALKVEEAKAVIFDHAEKYKWHDLRKNQEDLPERDGLYIIAVENTEGIETGFGYFENLFGYGDCWIERMPSFGKIIAWKYIEQFMEGA